MSAAEITQQIALVNELRLQNTDPTALDAARKKLSELKKTHGVIAKAGASSGATGTSDSKGGKKRDRLLLKTAKVSERCRSSFGDRMVVVINSRLTFCTMDSFPFPSFLF